MTWAALVSLLCGGDTLLLRVRDISGGLRKTCWTGRSRLESRYTKGGMGRLSMELTSQSTPRLTSTGWRADGGQHVQAAKGAGDGSDSAGDGDGGCGGWRIIHEPRITITFHKHNTTNKRHSLSPVMQRSKCACIDC